MWCPTEESLHAMGPESMITDDTEALSGQFKILQLNSIN